MTRNSFFSLCLTRRGRVLDCATAMNRLWCRQCSRSAASNLAERNDVYGIGSLRYYGNSGLITSVIEAACVRLTFSRLHCSEKLNAGAEDACSH